MIYRLIGLEEYERIKVIMPIRYNVAFIQSAIAGITTGLILGTIDIFLTQSSIRKRSFGFLVIIKGLIYIGSIIVVLSLIHFVTAIAVDKLTVQHIVGEMLAISEPPTALVEFVARVSEGNPFFVAEYLRLLVASNVLHRRRGQWVLPGASFDESTVEALPVPRSLQGILNRRLDQLSPSTRALMQAAAVLGRQFEVELLAETTDTPVATAREDLREAVDHQVLEEIGHGAFRFLHDKLLEACYAQIPDERRPQLHAAAARAIERRVASNADAPSAFAQLAHHYRHAGNKPKALEYIDKAATEALAKSAESVRELQKITGV